MEPFVPVLPRELRSLFLYLLERDGAAPEAAPVPVGITITNKPALGGGHNIDLIEWGYPLNVKRGPDGYIVAFASTATESPDEGRVLVSATARKHLMVWPSTVTTRSYAVAAFRNTYRGEQCTGFVSMPDWRIG